ncbi:hypothetical protein [Zavarzinella formosa]|uniref:hypothetical protein n=1 Tax=Zavarzinella formosa TaxID=360055 RepID=UPI0002E74B0D|nr:hypothetical protein [Zavarzinella formosa]
MSRLLFPIAAIVVQAVLAFPALAEDKKFVKPVNQWAGEIEDVAPTIGETRIFTDSASLAKWWKDSTAPGKVPEANFAQNFVVIVFNRGSSLDIKATMEGSTMSVFGYGTRDNPPGIRFVVGEFSREGVKKVNDKVLK